MGCDIHCFAEVRKDGKWQRVVELVFGECGTEPFGWRSYGMFGFLADVRNISKCNPICEPKGLPEDSEWLNSVSKYAYDTNPMNGQPIPIEERETNRKCIEDDWDYHSKSWLTLKELLDFDYNQTFEDLRDRQVMKGDNTVMFGAIFDKTTQPGEGTIKTYREFLGEGFFSEIDILKTLGEPEDVRIIFWFDN